MNARNLTVLLLAVCGLAAVPVASAQTASKQLIPFQGRLTDQSNVPYDNGQYTITFNLYDAAIGGTTVWTERHENVSVIKGTVNVFLGSIAPFDRATPSLADDVDFSTGKYLGVTVDADNNAATADPEMVPRTMILPAFHAKNADNLRGFDWSAILEGGSNNPTNAFIRGDRLSLNSITSDRIVDGSISLGDLSPAVVNELTGTLVQSTDIPGFTAMENIAAFDAVAVTRDANNNARIVKANSTIGSRSAFYGFARAAATNGGPVTVHQYGPLSGFTNLAPASSYFVGASNGTITVSNTGTQIYAGYSMAANTLFVDPLGTTRRWASANYWGDGSDGGLDTTGNVSFASTVDGDVVVKQFTSLTINEGHTVTVSNRCRGLVIYVDGNCTINGTLTMTARGANVDPSQPNSIPATGIRLVRRKSGATETLSASDLGGNGAGGVGVAWRAAETFQSGIQGNGKVYSVSRVGGAGGARGTLPGALFRGNPGQAITDGTGGGGSGAASDATGGGGSAGTCFSGGSGGGAATAGGTVSGLAGTDAAPYGGIGGTGIASGIGNQQFGGGGAGNPGGGGFGGGSTSTGASGTGGLLILLVRGDINIGPSGSVVSAGSDGAKSPDGVWGVQGGSSGGGRVLVLYAGTINGNQRVQAPGGLHDWDGFGGAGSVTIDQIDR